MSVLNPIAKKRVSVASSSRTGCEWRVCLSVCILAPKQIEGFEYSLFCVKDELSAVLLDMYGKSQSF